MSRERLKIRPLGGLREGARGERGEAADMVNFTVTGQGLLTLRPGVRALELPFGFDTRGQVIRGLWAGVLGRGEFLAVATSPAGEYGANGDYIQVFRRKEEGFAAAALLPRPFGAKTAWVQFFTFCGELYALSDQGYLRISDGGISTVDTPGFRAQAVEAYVPLVVTGASPAGGGTALEQVNRLTNRRRISYSDDGSAAYRLPEEAVGVAAVQVSGESLDSPGSFDAESRVYTFRTPPAAGTDNVEITYLAASSDRARVLGMRCSETYNGDTDTRLFLYGDGSNTCIYSGVTQGGAPSAAYFPAMNEIRVDGADAPITGLLRHGGSLLAFKPDGTWSIAYSPLTLPDGTVTAGFYLRPLHKSLGNYALGQVALVENCPRTVTPGALYDWQLPEGYHRDERQERLASEQVASFLRGKTVAFTGNSGVGKSSLLNCLAPGLGLAVGEVSEKLGRGRHTTRHVELFSLGGGTYVADTPGFSSFDTDQMDLILKENLQYAFPDFAPYLGKCQFHDCAHRAEPGCAVRAAVEAGAISPSRYDSYARLYAKAKEIRLWETKQR